MLFEDGRSLKTDERSGIETLAGREMKMHMFKIRIARALKHNVPNATEVVYDVRDFILLWREKGHKNNNG